MYLIARAVYFIRGPPRIEHPRTWQKQHPGVPGALVNMYAPHAVEPNIVLLENGVVALTSGRPGQFLWTVHVDDLVPGNESLAQWSVYNIFEAHNAAARAGLLPAAMVYVDRRRLFRTRTATCFPSAINRRALDSYQDHHIFRAHFVVAGIQRRVLMALHPARPLATRR